MAEELSEHTAPLRRAAGPHRGWTAAGIGIASVGGLALFVGGVFAEQPGSPWRYPLLILGALALGLGALVAVWAGTDKLVRIFNQYIRASEVAKRIVSRIASFAVTIVVAVWMVTSVQANSSTITLIGILAVQMIAVGLSVSALSASPPLIGVLTRVRPGRARVWSLFAWLVACIVAGAGAAVVASRLQSQVATVGVVITIAAVFLATYTQQRHTFDARLDTLQKSLSTLHRHLTTGESDSQIIEAATDLEAALTLYPPAPFSLPIPLPIDNALRACLFFALTRVTGLPFREVLTEDASILEKRLVNQNLRLELASLVWELRRRVLRSASVVNQQDTSRYDPLPSPSELTEPANEETAEHGSTAALTSYPLAQKAVSTDGGRPRRDHAMPSR